MKNRRAPRYKWTDEKDALVLALASTYRNGSRTNWDAAEHDPRYTELKPISRWMLTRRYAVLKTHPVSKHNGAALPLRVYGAVVAESEIPTIRFCPNCGCNIAAYQEAAHAVQIINARR